LGERGYFRFAYALEKKAIEKALPGFKGEIETYGVNASNP
jgi:hypothetical protein